MRQSYAHHNGTRYKSTSISHTKRANGFQNRTSTGLNPGIRNFASMCTCAHTSTSLLAMVERCLKLMKFVWFLQNWLRCAACEGCCEFGGHPRVAGLRAYYCHAVDGVPACVSVLSLCVCCLFTFSRSSFSTLVASMVRSMRYVTSRRNIRLQNNISTYHSSSYVDRYSWHRSDSHRGRSYITGSL